MINRKKTLLVLALLPAFLYGCYNDNAEDLYPSTAPGSACDTANITYSASIKPIIDAKCAIPGCHQTAMPTGYDLSSHAGLTVVANNGRLIPAIDHTGPNPMPQGAPKLDDCSITKIKKWVAMGAPNN